jgi:outer membrane biosynthesis protein TonB
MAFLIIAIVIISAVAAFLLLKKQRQSPVEQSVEQPVVEQPATPIVSEAEKVVKAVKKPEPKKKMAAKPVEKKPIIVEKAPAKKPAKKGK